MMDLDLRYYLLVFWRRFPWFLVVATLVAAGALTMAILLPTTYEARARLLVEDPQIPDRLAASTVQADPFEQLEILEQRLMTRANLIEIAHNRRVFPDQASMSPDEIFQAMKDHTRITRRGNRRGQANLMEIAFRAERPEVAAQVVNDYVTILMRDSIALRKGRAEETQAFFEQEVERLSKELEAQSARILEFKSRNRDALPEELNYRLERQGRLQERLTQLLRDRTLLSEQRARLIEIFNATGQINPEDAPLDPAQVELTRAEQELAEALTIYSPENPRVKLLQARVDRLRKAAGVAADEAQEAEASAGRAESARTLLDLQLSEIDRRIAFIDEQMEATRAELAELEKAIEKTPGVAIALEGLMRDYENVQAQYNGAIQRLSLASTGERIELSSKGQRISVIENAVTPTKPVSPNRPKIIAAGLAAALAAGLGVVVLLEFINRSVRRGADLTKSLGISPIGVIPYRRTVREAVIRRALIAGATIAVGIGVPVALYFVHTRYMPLDILLQKVMNRLGM